MAGEWQAFGPDWFEKHQRGLLRLLRWKWFQWCLRIETNKRITRILPHCFIVALGEGLYQAKFHTHWNYSKRLYQAFKPLWWALHFWDWLVADRFAPKLSFGFLTLTAVPDLSSGSTTCDGEVDLISTASTWASIHDAADGNTVSSPSAAELFVGLRTSATTNRFDELYRSFLTFNTAALTTGYTITIISASLSVVQSSSDDTLGASPQTNIYAATPASNNVFVNADYDQIGTTALCDTAITFAAWQATIVFGFNATGRAALSLTGITKLGLRNSNYDVANVAPTWGNNKYSYVACYSRDQVGSDPTLTVTYTPTSAGGCVGMEPNIVVGNGMSRCERAT